MRTIEKLGITEDTFKKMYKEYSGFNNMFNKNHPAYGCDEEFLIFLKAGSESLIREHQSIIMEDTSRS